MDDENKYELTFTFITMTNMPEIKISGKTQDVVKAGCMILLAFGSKPKDNLCLNWQGVPYQQCTEKLKQGLQILMKSIPDPNYDFGKLYNIFKDMKVGEWFAFFPNSLTEGQVEIVRDELLKRSLSKEDYENFTCYIQNEWQDIIDNYDMIAYANKNKEIHSIGEKDREKRICRFCGKDSQHTSFKNKSHSISEALGNKTIITNDECDTCNSFFGKEIESDLINMLDPFRVFFGIKGKGGNKKFKSADFEISKNHDTNQIKIDVIESDNNPYDKTVDPNNMCLKFVHPQKINLQNVYRSIVKYALSVIDVSLIKNFTKTISWINKDYEYKNLSWVTILLTNKTSDDLPSISVYIRKNDNNSLPYSFVNLQVAGMEIIAIIPLSSKDMCDFSQKEDFDRFWNFLKPYNQMTILKRFQPIDDIANEFKYNWNFVSNSQSNQNKDN